MAQTTWKSLRWGLMPALGGVILLLVPGCGGGGGADNGGTLSGRVTNAMTEAGIADVAVMLDPAVDGIEITTDADGAYSQAVPIGVYTVSFENAKYESSNSTVSVNSGQTTRVDGALTPVEPVVVTAVEEGDAAPDGTVTVMATAEVLDGTSTVQSYAWTQSNSVDVEIVSPSSATTTVRLPGLAAYKAELINILKEPPIGEDQLPPNVPLPEGEFPGGLQDRWHLVGLDPFALEETGLVTLEVTVTTSSGSYKDTVEIHAELPWRPAAGILNVPLGIPVLLYGKTQDSYNWDLDAPSGSGAALQDASTQSPEFVPDADGLYTVTVVDRTVDPSATVTLEIYAGAWEGAITGQNAEGRPLAANCTACHNGSIAPDVFTPWMETGHAEILTNNLNNSSHYGANCFPCHTVGYDTTAANDGMDDQSDYQAFLDSSLIHDTGPDQWTMMLDQFPDSARMANIQCENCHGPNNGGAHTMGEPRLSLSSSVCATCHGEPLRHARYQQWQLSGHANYELAVDEGESGNCSRCHTVNGFLAWLPILTGEEEGDPLASIEVTWTPDETHPQTCVTCHDPHMIGTTTGENTDAIIRISGDTPPLIAGFQAFGVGRGAMCMTCHNSRRGLRNDDTFAETTAAGDASRAPHGSSQTDVLMGENAYLTEVGIRGNHSLVEDSCVDCHMDQTDPPELLSYNLGGTNHTFFASDTICANCHEEIAAGTVQSAYEANSDELQSLVEEAIDRLMTSLINDGNSIDLNGEATITNAGDIREIVFGEARGRQAITVTLGSGTFGPMRVNDVGIVAGGEEIGNLYDFADERLIKAGWNYNLGENDGSHGVHNPTFVFKFLDAGIDALHELQREEDGDS